MVCAQFPPQVVSSAQTPLNASQDTGPGHILGQDDGVIFPESHFDASLPNLRRLMRTAAQDRPPLRGVINVCVALVEFSDKHFGDGVRSHIEDTFFSTGKLPKGSVNEYYKEVSNGKISIAGTVVGPYQMPLRMDEYAGFANAPDNNNFGKQSVTPNIRTLGQDALDQSHAALGDLSRYDNDKNGYVDAFIVVHAGHGAEVTNNHHDLWSVKWVLPNVATYNNTHVYGFLTVPEDVTTGVGAHELGHLLFGWPDLYDTTVVNNVYASRGIGDWCLMSHGSWLDNGNRPCHPSAWCKVNQGWVDLTTEEDARTISLGPVQTTMDVRRLWKGGIKESREYFLLENRQKIRGDSLLPGAGLLVWHIDDSKYNNADKTHRKVELMQADGLDDLSKPYSQGNNGDPGDPFPGTAAKNAFNAASTPNSNSYAGVASQVAISNIVSTNNNITLDVNVGGGVVGWDSGTFMAPESAMDSSQIAAVSRTSGHMELFWIGRDGSIQHAWWFEGQGWNNGTLMVADSGSVLPGGGITAISRNSSTISVFWVSPTLTIEHMFWEEGKDWQRSTVASAGAVAKGTQLTVVSRSPDRMELFWCRNNEVDHAWFHEGEGWGWGGVWGANTTPKFAITAISKAPDSMDVFIVETNGRVHRYTYTDAGFWTSGQVFPQQDNSASLQTGLAAVSRQPDHKEVFWIRDDGKVLHTWTFGGNFWDWAELGHPGTAKVGDITAIARSSNKVDVFWTQADGSIQQAYWRNGSPWQFSQVKPADNQGGGLEIACVSRVSNSIDVWALRSDRSITNAFSTTL